MMSYRGTYRVNHAFDSGGPDDNIIELHGIQGQNGNKNNSKGGSNKRMETEKYDLDDHRIPLHDLYKRYSTNPEKGLASSQVEVNRTKFGKNVLTPPKKASKLLKFFGCVFGGLNALLWGCAVLSLGSYFSQYLYTDSIATDNLYLGIALIIVVHVSGTFEYYQQFKSDRIMESFKNMVPHFCIVTRDDQKSCISVEDVVVGDIIDLKYGDLIPADVRLIQVSEFKVDNSSLTGESEPQKRSTTCTSPDNVMESRNFAFFSTNAVEGRARGIVVRTGPNTFMGRLATMASTLDSGTTPIQKEMSRFIVIMTIRSFVFGGTFFGIAMLMGYQIADAVFFVIGIVVANVPEGLTVTFTSVLALTAKRMANSNCLVKNVQAVETLGSTSVICSDKTGTLTQNRMSVAHLWCAERVIEAAEARIQSALLPIKAGFEALTNVAILCSQAVFDDEDRHLEPVMRRVNGDASETAILRCMEELIGDVDQVRERSSKLMEIPFNSSNKYQVSIHDMRHDPIDPSSLLVMKGAPERIINFCSTVLTASGQVVDLDDGWRDEINRVYASFGTHGERVLGFCDCRLPLETYPIGFEFNTENSHDFLTIGFRFVGLISMIDPPRATVPNAVAKCKSAGIKVVMVTGDHPVTAKAIARAVGILSPDNPTIEEMALAEGFSVDDIDPSTVKAAVVSGAELDLLKPEQLLHLLINHTEIVFARTSPEQKFVIVDAFQQLGHVVAATGDGVNDSPALKKADIGIAMGLTGTEVSKEVADMILMDDNFATIVAGVEEGRLIFDNLKKLICYNLADNIAEMYSVWVFIILGCPLPMGTMAMILSVLFTDVLPAISIAHEKSEADIMNLKPRNPRTDNLVTGQLLSYTYGQTSVFEVTSGFFAFFVTMGYNGFLPDLLYGIGSAWENSAINDLKDSYGQEWTYHDRKELGYTAQTAFFASIVLTQVSNVIVCKTRRLSLFQKGMGNWFMNIAIVIELGLLCMLIYTPYLNASINLRPLRPEIFLLPIPFMLAMITYDEFRRLAIRLTTKGSWVHSEFYT